MALVNVLTWILLLGLAADEPRNPWRERVAPARAAVESRGTPESFRDALDATWRADHWQAGADLARSALEKYPDDESLRGLVARALWRAGRLDEAEKVADAHRATSAAAAARDSATRDGATPDGATATAAAGSAVARTPAGPREPVLLTTLISINLARGRTDDALRQADLLETLPPKSAVEWSAVAAARMQADRLDGIVDVLRKVKSTADPNNGYPEIYMPETFEGMIEFAEAVGSKPLNVIAAHGEARIFMMPLINLPACDVLINGEGPYRLILDTGGSTGLSLDAELAEEIGVRALAAGNVRGVSGKDAASHALIEELRIGSIVCKRVITRTFGVRKALMNAADGIIGTGIFARGRMTLDFSVPRLVIGPSREESAGGAEIHCRILADSKLYSLVDLNGGKALGLFDSGADAVALSRQTLHRLHPFGKKTELGAAGIGVGQGESATITTGPGVDLKLAGRDFSNYSGLAMDVLDNLLSPMLGAQTDILIGMPVFRQTRSVTVDFPLCRMWIEWLPERK